MLTDGLLTVRELYRSLASSRWPVHRLRRLQTERMRQLVAHAYHNVPLYQTLYNQADFHPEDFQSLEDLDKIPMLDKNTLKAARPEQVIARGVNSEQCATVLTSGSTGIPVRIYLGPREQRWQCAVAWRIMFENGYRWTDRTLEIRAPRCHKEERFVQRLGIAPKDWVSALDPPESWARRLADSRYQVIMSTSWALYELAEAVERLGVDIVRPRLIISDTSTLTQTARRVIKRALGADPVDVYGLVESSNCAWQCERRQGLHISQDSHILEVMAPPGEVGPMLVTAFGMWTMPIIRFETGDLGEADPLPCPCGRSFSLIKRISGRTRDIVVLPGGGRLYWHFFTGVLSGYDEVRQWQVVQYTQEGAVVRVVLKRTCTELIDRLQADFRAAVEEFQIVPEDFDISLEQVDAISTASGKKLRMIISHVETAL